jgi:ABC-type antimicrobial peptide transport system permease subunit
MPYATVATMSQLYEWQLRPLRLGSTVLGLFAVLSLATAAVGVYGVLSYFVAHRTREIGVRVALGATPRQVLMLVLRQGAGIAMSGVAAGALASQVAGRFLASSLYEVSPTDKSILAESAALLLAIACAACYGPARRATRIDPVAALRV